MKKGHQEEEGERDRMEEEVEEAEERKEEEEEGAEKEEKEENEEEGEEDKEEVLEGGGKSIDHYTELSFLLVIRKEEWFDLQEDD